MIFDLRRPTLAVSRLLIALLAVVVLAGPAFADADLPKVDIVFATGAEADELLARAEEKTPFWRLMRGFVSERELTFCGVATAAMTLNALDVKPPPSPEIHPFSVFDQYNLFTAEALAVKSVGEIQRSGLTLEEVAAILRSHGAEVAVRHAGEYSLAQFREEARAALRGDGSIVTVNFARAGLGMEGPGHHSPLAAYDEASDRFLMLDVARYEWPPSWVRAEDLYRAMNTRDDDAGKQRGWLVVRAQGSP
ncbi:MAG: phytochelatin synthase family protein [Halothiobacillaceae bacterium]